MTKGKLNIRYDSNGSPIGRSVLGGSAFYLKTKQEKEQAKKDKIKENMYRANSKNSSSNIRVSRRGSNIHGLSKRASQMSRLSTHLMGDNRREGS